MADGAKLYPDRYMGTISNAIRQTADAFREHALAETEARWYAAYTCANREKKAASEILRRGVEAFLPLYHTARRWSDRRVELQLPHLKATSLCIFHCLNVSKSFRFLEWSAWSDLVACQAHYLTNRWTACVLVWMDVHESSRILPLTVGRRVTIKRGPLAGMSGILLRRKGRLRLVVSISLIQRAVSVDADEADVEEEPR